MMTHQEFYNEIEILLDQQPGTLKGTEKLTDMKNWDSLAVVSLIAMVDSKLESSVTTKQINECKTLADVAALFPDKVCG